MRAESLFQALQSERDSFTQLQQAMEAEKRRGKASQQREQQIIEVEWMSLHDNTLIMFH